MDALTDSAGSGTDLKKSRRRRPAMDVLKTDRLPPHAEDMERGVLGCVLLSPNECLGQCIEKFKAGPEVFYDLRHQTIYAEFVEMFDKREVIDVLTVHQRLKDKQLLEQVGGIAYLNALQDAVPSAANVTYYADVVQEKYLLRRMIRVCTDVVGRVYEHEGEVDALMDEVERDVLRISEARVGTSTIGIKELVHKAINTVED
jgi:replicative DNA helicase